MKPRERQVTAPSQAMIVDQARRAGAARALAGVFLVLSLVAFGAVVYLPAPAAAPLVIIGSAVVYALIWHYARIAEHASRAGAAIVATHLAVAVLSSSMLERSLDVVQVAYNTALVPLVAAATLRARGVIVTGAVGALALLVQVFWHTGENGYARFVSPAIYFAATWVVAAVSSIASHFALRAHTAEERRAEAARTAARIAEARYELVAEHVSDLVSLFAADGRYLYASPSHERVLGVKPDELVGQTTPELVHPDDLPLLQAAFIKALGGEPATAVARLRAANGEYRWFHVGLSGLSNLEVGEPGVAVSARDITEQRELSEALEKTRRMEALGNLAGAVAHDFNNLLMVIQSCTDLAVGTLPSEHPARADLDDVNSAVQRAAALTHQLLTFARRQVLPATERSFVARTAQELAPILARLCGKSVALVLDVHDSSRVVDASATQVEQLLMNLSANACDAMPRGGSLHVDIRDRTLSEGEVAELAPGNYVEISVGDTGSGISAEVQQHMFEPFYTTKAAGRGTGLGLATVFGLVSQLKGHISVRSSPGAGSTFTVLLPQASAEHALQAALPAIPTAERALHVLVIDDEAGVRTSVARMLTNAGHRVSEASTVDGAVTTVEAPDAHFDAIVTDVVIGAEDGIRMLERIHSAQPDAAVVVMSGFSPSPERVAAVTAQGAEFLAKPFGASALLSTLDRARARRKS
ncbi:MAG TPA: ATP-binding protein [Polyangiaceae bacterium]|nr:ATP-binding protein [Polyangiaceae bacterium]